MDFSALLLLPNYLFLLSPFQSSSLHIFYKRRKKQPLLVLQTMVVTQGHEVLGGWPLGLENMNTRLRVAESSQVVAAAAATGETTLRLYMNSPSFSSFSSSNLDTESTMSFFQDQSVSLGRLIGIRPPGNRGRMDLANRFHLEKNEQVSARRRPDESEEEEGDNNISQNKQLCVPLLHNVLEKMSRSKSNSHSPKHSFLH